MSNLVINEGKHHEVAKEFQHEVWAWLGPMVGATIGVVGSELAQTILTRTVLIKRPSFLTRVAADTAAAVLGWGLTAAARPTPDEKRKVVDCDFDAAKSVRAQAWGSDLVKVGSIAFEKGDVAAMGFFGLPPEAIELSATKIEEIIARRIDKIRVDYSGARQEILLAGANGFAKRIRHLRSRRTAHI